jgi:hypothetical protein
MCDECFGRRVVMRADRWETFQKVTFVRGERQVYEVERAVPGGPDACMACVRHAEHEYQVYVAGRNHG